jgi:acetyl/propionyl-CoA carboxylase alpha subunit
VIRTAWAMGLRTVAVYSEADRDAKASAGGGGRGMRIVRPAGELAAAIASAKREALAAFGDDRMLIEKFVDNPRYIEVITGQHDNPQPLTARRR